MDKLIALTIIIGTVAALVFGMWWLVTVAWNTLAHQFGWPETNIWLTGCACFLLGIVGNMVKATVSSK